MANRLKNVLAFTNVAAGGSSSQSHNLNLNGASLTPDYYEPDQPGFTVAVTSTTVTVTNNGNAPASVNVFVEHYHTIERVTGGAAWVPFNAGRGWTAPGASSYITPGDDKAAEINAAITAAAAAYVATGRPQTVTLGPGTYTLEAPINMQSGVKLQGDSRTTTFLVPTHTGDPSSTSNYAIGIVGALDTATMNTTLTAIAPKSSNSIAVTAAGTIAAGDYILIRGRNVPQSDGGQDANGESDGAQVILSEVIKVASTYAGGTTIPTAWPTYQHHQIIGITVQAVTPVVFAEVRDLTIQGSVGGVTTAFGIYVNYATDVEIHNVGAYGCARYAVEAEGVVRFKSSGFYNLGTNNGWYRLRSVFTFDVYEFSGAEDGERCHPLGIPWYPIVVERRSVNGVVRDGFLNHSYFGIYSSGGHQLTFENIKIRDIAITQAIYDRSTASGEMPDGAHAILGWGSGWGNLDYASFSMDVKVSQVSAETLSAPLTAAWTGNPFRAVIYYLHDSRSLVASDLAAVERGVAPAVTGLIASDVSGTLTNYYCQGYSFGFCTENVEITLQVVNYQFGGLVGVSPNATIPVYFNHHAADGSGRIRFVKAYFANAFSAIRFGGEYTFNDDATFEDLVTDWGEWSYAVPMYNNTGVNFGAGDVVEIDPSHTGSDIRVRTPNTGVANYQRRLAVVVSGTSPGADVGTGPVIVAPLPQARVTVMAAAAAAIAYGDSIEYVATRRVQANNATTYALGCALTRKTAGSESLILIGLVP